MQVALGLIWVKKKNRQRIPRWCLGDDKTYVLVFRIPPDIDDGLARTKGIKSKSYVEL